MNQKDNPSLDKAEVVRLCGEVLDWQVQAIISSGASFEELEEAVAYVAGEDDVMGEERKPLTGRVAQVFEILTRDEPWSGEDRGQPGRT